MKGAISERPWIIELNGSSILLVKACVECVPEGEQIAAFFSSKEMAEHAITQFNIASHIAKPQRMPSPTLPRELIDAGTTHGCLDFVAGRGMRVFPLEQMAAALESLSAANLIHKFYDDSDG